jgi:Protein of unknown function (DUF2845)
MQRVAAISALAILIPSIALCDEFRCGSWLVSAPLPLPELIKKCGQPSSRQVSTQDVRTKVAGGGTMKIGATTTEVWRYDRGSGASPMIVTIVDGVIQSIE